MTTPAAPLPVSRITRRAFLRWSAAGAAALAAGAVADGYFWEPSRIDASEIPVPIRGLPPAFEGFRIAVVADLHHGTYVGLDRVREIVAHVAGRRADLIALVGDYVYASPRYIAPAIEALAGLSAPSGVVAVLGNHDHWENAPLTRRALAKAGIPELRNSHVVVARGGARLVVAGVGDLWEDVADPEAAVAGAPEGAPRVLLSHNPDVAETLGEGARIDLVLAGHTHGGQICVPLLGPLLIPSRYGRKYAAGLVRAPNTLVHVSRGLGLIGLPFRFNCPPEAPVITLRAA